jgi:hypothetical protein
MKSVRILSISAVLLAFFVSRAELIAHWELDETSGSIASDSANSNEGTLINSPTWLSVASAKIAGALDFDGVDQIVSAPVVGLPTGNAPRSIALWLYADVERCFFRWP